MLKQMISILFIQVFGLAIGQAAKYSASCSVPLCVSNTNASCATSTLCYAYQSSTNQIICAPSVQCSLFDTCSQDGKCQSNTSVCIINSCCPQSICMALALASTCSPNNDTNLIQNGSTTNPPSTTRMMTTTTANSTTTSSAHLWVSGVQLNFDPRTLSSGWSLCYNGRYNIVLNPTLRSTILNTCNKAKLMLGCRPIGNALLSVAAMGLRADVLYNCSTVSDCTRVANGVGWYYSDNWSWGFANGNDKVNRTSCDTSMVNGAYRLCWHTHSSGGGWRCGNITDLNSDGTYERVIYHSI